MKKVIWISYDLGIDGDYGELYRWLDAHNAKECGDSLAVIVDYECNRDLITEIKKEITSNVKIRKNDRIYIIYKDENNRLKGKFLFGKRKKPPWEGYSKQYWERGEEEGEE